MPHPRQPGSFHLCHHGQRGATLMIMLVIMVMGAATYLVSSLSTTALKNARQEKTAAALAQAKDALLGRAIKDASRPGSLPCPDTDNDGSAELFAGNICPSYVGWLPWRTLGLPDLRDGDGVRLWYALSSSVRDHSTAQPINSDTQGLLSITGNISLNNVTAIVFAPGAPLCGKSHATNNVDQYLEAMSSVTAPAIINSNSNDCNNSPYNDNLLAITADQIFQPVEKRIAREVKACLDQYAANSASKYPWAAPVNDPNYMGKFGSRFGGLSHLQPNISTSPSSAEATALYAALGALQTTVNNFASNGSPANKTALTNAGNYVISLKNTIPAITNFVNTAGDWAVEFANGDHSQLSVTNKINLAYVALTPYLNLSPDPTMSSTWTSFCTTLFSSSYWPDWKELVFYQVADDYRPGATLGCDTTCLSVKGSGNPYQGSGNYRAAVIVAGKKLGTQTRPTFADPPNDYLANTVSEKSLDPAFVSNAHSNAVPTTTFITYKPSDPYYQSVNDLVICLDGNVNCK